MVKRVYYLIILFSSFFCIRCNAPSDQLSEISSNDVQVSEGKENLPEITFDSEEYDFGKITQGEVVNMQFRFKNTGQKNLIISGASGSCGCTVPKWPREPILPGQEGVINVVFSSEGKKGYQEKTITIATNCQPATRILKIKGEIVVPETIK